MGKRRFAANAEGFPQPPDATQYAWVDREVLGIETSFVSVGTDSMTLVENEEDEYKYELIAPDDDERVCSNRSTEDRDRSFYVYETFFKTLGLRLPFSEFQQQVLDFLSVAPTQLHPNSWGFVRAFELFCRARDLLCSVNVFFWMFQVSYSTNKEEEAQNRHGWVSLRAKNFRGLFTPVYTSYKGFKVNFFRVKVVDGVVPFFHRADGSLMFPLYWNEGHFRHEASFYSVSDERLTPVESLVAQEMLNWLTVVGSVKCRGLVRKTDAEFITFIGNMANPDMIRELQCLREEEAVAAAQETVAGLGGVPIQPALASSTKPTVKRKRVIVKEKSPVETKDTQSISDDHSQSEGRPMMPFEYVNAQDIPASIDEALLPAEGDLEPYLADSGDAHLRHIKKWAVCISSLAKFLETHNPWEVKLSKAAKEIDQLKGEFQEVESQLKEKARLAEKRARNAEQDLAAARKALKTLDSTKKELEEARGSLEESKKAHLALEEEVGRERKDRDKYKKYLSSAVESTFTNALEQFQLLHPLVKVRTDVMSSLRFVEGSQLMEWTPKGQKRVVDVGLASSQKEEENP